MLIVFTVSACQGGTINTPDAGCTPGGCPEGERCVDGTCQPQTVIAPCDVLECPEGQECRDGRCWSANPCEGVTCGNPSDVCDPRTGVCHTGATDDDGDGYTINNGDCDDGDPDVHPDAAEVCDGSDQNCNWMIDEGFPDDDGDGFDTCGVGVAAQADCNDGDFRVFPGATELCDGVDQDCDGEIDDGFPDDDGDGFDTCGAGVAAQADCNDGAPNVFPGATELCDGVDQDCDGEIDDGFPDDDGDGFDTCGVGVAAQADCNDGAPNVFPGATELCDGVDEDCDGEIDDGVPDRECSTACGQGEERCEGGGWFCSVPDSCECTPVGRVESDACGRCGERARTCQADLTWGPWSSCTGEGACVPGTLDTCTTTCGSIGERSCDSTCAWRPCEPPTETCNAADDDCDGDVDLSSCLVTVYRFYNATTGDHMYKADTFSADPGYVLEEGPPFHLYRSAVPGTFEIFQVTNGVDHMLALDPDEGSAAGYSGATSLGYAGPLSSWDVAGGYVAVEVCRYYNGSTGDHMLWLFIEDGDVEATLPGYVRESCPNNVWLLE